MDARRSGEPTPAKNRTAAQQTMLRKAGRIHAVRWGSALAVLLLIGFLIRNIDAAVP